MYRTPFFLPMRCRTPGYFRALRPSCTMVAQAQQRPASGRAYLPSSFPFMAISHSGGSVSPNWGLGPSQFLVHEQPPGDSRRLLQKLSPIPRCVSAQQLSAPRSEQKMASRVQSTRCAKLKKMDLYRLVLAVIEFHVKGSSILLSLPSSSPTSSAVLSSERMTYLTPRVKE
jgi:hypothetical protein